MKSTLELINAVEEILDAHVVAGGLELAEHKELTGDKSELSSVNITYQFRSSYGFSFIAHLYHFGTKGEEKKPFLNLDIAFAKVPEKGREGIYKAALNINRNGSFGECLSLIDDETLGLGWRHRVDGLSMDYLKSIVARFLSSAEEIYRELRVDHDIQRFYDEPHKKADEQEAVIEAVPEEKTNVTKFRQRNLV